jgi:hypothetical protein
MVRPGKQEPGDFTRRAVFMATYLCQLVEAALPVAKVVVGIDDRPGHFFKGLPKLIGLLRCPQGQRSKSLPIREVELAE